jgi:ubiquitin-activating enzyme E1
LKNFPNQIEHTIQWARDKFEGQFAEAYQELSMFVNSKDRFMKKVREEFEEKRKTGMLGPLRTSLENVNSLFAVYKAGSYEECVKMGRLLF